ncbi:cdkn1a interacting zinc finger protein 1b [Aplochiton taeniatus]
MQRWCTTCQSHFSGDLILHRRTNQHKLCKQASRPFCSVCKRHFRTPRKFVEHMKSPGHKQQLEQLRQEETLEEELITVDAVGCFEGEEDCEEEEKEEEEEDKDCEEEKEDCEEEEKEEEEDCEEEKECP